MKFFTWSPWFVKSVLKKLRNSDRPSSKLIMKYQHLRAQNFLKNLFLLKNQKELAWSFLMSLSNTSCGKKKQKRILLKFWGLSGAEVWRSCRSRQELSNECLLAKIDTAENEPLKVSGSFTYVTRNLTRPLPWPGSGPPPASCPWTSAGRRPLWWWPLLGRAPGV